MISGSTLTVIIVIGGIFGIILLLLVASVLLSRALYRLNNKTRLDQERRFEEHRLQEGNKITFVTSIQIFCESLFEETNTCNSK